MNDVLFQFPATRTAALERLQRFIPHAGRTYAAKRNFDLGPGAHRHVSTLSPYLRTRLLTEPEVLRAVLGRHSATSAEKFIQEVYWRTYWKGWLELRPGVWRQYRVSLKARVNEVQTQSGLRQRWQDACTGNTGIEVFDGWARELARTGYLHNHARMWFASIWIFTLDLPWELGADFFLRHLLDGDPASNTLSWRWVAGIQTPGKTYLARAANIARYTEGRIIPKGQLASDAPARSAAPPPDPRALPASGAPGADLRTGLILHSEDLSPAFVLDRSPAPAATLLIDATGGLSPWHMAPHVAGFQRAAMADVTQRWQDRLGDVTGPATTPEHVARWAHDNGIAQIVTAHAPVGPVASLLDAAAALPDMPPLRRVMRPYDATAWPRATKGFFAFKTHIPALLGTL